MQLLIKETCVVKGGRIREKGEIHDTQVEDSASDREAFDLIASGRALDYNTEEARELKKKFDLEAQHAANAAKAGAAQPKR